MSTLITTSAGTLKRRIALVPLHADTQAAVTWLTGIGESLSIPQTNALDRLVRDLHGESNPSYTTSDIWFRFIGIYPVPGSTAGSHSLNLRSPGTFTLFYDPTNVTHDAAGIHTVSTGRIYTGIVPNEVLDINSKHISFRQSDPLPVGAARGYCLNASTAGQPSADGFGISLSFVFTDPEFYPNLSTTTGVHFSYPGISTIRFVSMSRTDATTLLYQCNGIPRSEIRGTGAGQNTTMLIVPESGGGGATVILEWLTYGHSLTAAELVNLENAVNAYLTGIGKP